MNNYNYHNLEMLHLIFLTFCYFKICILQCYDKYLQSILTKDALRQQYDLHVTPAKDACSYNDDLDSNDFFTKEERFNCIDSRYFLYWYSTQLQKHGHEMLSLARNTLGEEVAINVKVF